MTSILVIDDEPAIRTVLQRVLEKAGHTVQLASNGVEGLESLEAQMSDVVITDIIMPTMHGVDAIKTEAYLAAAKLAGAHAVLNKPFHSKDVLQAIATATGSSG